MARLNYQQLSGKKLVENAKRDSAEYLWQEMEYRERLNAIKNREGKNNDEPTDTKTE